MNFSEVKQLKIEEVPTDDELPWRVEIIGKTEAYGAGPTLADALMRAFSVSGLFSGETKQELAQFLFWSFDGTGNWLRAIQALQDNQT